MASQFGKETYDVTWCYPHWYVHLQHTFVQNESWQPRASSGTRGELRICFSHGFGPVKSEVLLVKSTMLPNDEPKEKLTTMGIFGWTWARICNFLWLWSSSNVCDVPIVVGSFFSTFEIIWDFVEIIWTTSGAYIPNHFMFFNMNSL